MKEPPSHSSLLFASPPAPPELPLHDDASRLELLHAPSCPQNDAFGQLLRASDPPKPFAAFGSFRQRHGDVSDRAARTTRLGCRSGLSTEAPAKLGSDVSHRGGLSQMMADSDKRKKAPGCPKGDLPASPIDIIQESSALSERKTHSRLQKGRSFSSDLDRDAAWERKRDLYLLEGEEDEVVDAFEASTCDFADREWPERPEKPLSRTRTRSLTDEDLEELRGSIDLGFGFLCEESSDLKSTLPALELYYAINRQYVDAKSRSSPVSTLDGITLDRTYSAPSPGSPSNETWRVSSPGDHPSQVKTRLRHWAQAVACSLKQGF